VGTTQASAEQASLAPATSQAAELVRTLDLRTISLLEGSLHVESSDDRIILSTLKIIGMNIEALPNEILHVMNARVTKELKARE